MLFNVLASTLFASSALAHFTLDYPTSRGFEDEIEDQFCGGFKDVSSPRQPFPLGEGPIWIDASHAHGNVVAVLSTKENPVDFGDFNKTDSSEFQYATNVFQGKSCWNVDLGNLGLNLTNGSVVTLQIQYSGGDGDLYQCTDLVLLSNYTVPENETCTSDAAAAFSATASGAAASETGNSTTNPSGAPSASATPSSAQAVRVAAGAGVIGAVGMLALVLV